MTIFESLACCTTIDIDNIIEKKCIDRNIDSTLDYDATYRLSPDYNLALADIYMELFMMPDIKEQDIVITLPQRTYFFDQAQRIYSKFEETSFHGDIYGFTGNKLNKIRK